MEKLAAIEERARPTSTDFLEHVVGCTTSYTEGWRAVCAELLAAREDVPALCKALRVALEGLRCEFPAAPCRGVMECPACVALAAALAELPGAEAGGER